MTAINLMVKIWTVVGLAVFFASLYDHRWVAMLHGAGAVIIPNALRQIVIYIEEREGLRDDPVR